MAELKLTAEEFNKIADIIYRKTGIRFEQKKEYYIIKRLRLRMEELNIDNPMDYIRLLRFADKDGRELQNLINILTVNETYFFRDYPQLKTFAEHCLYDVCERKLSENDKTIKIWSAGCSTGEEPYTISMILHEMLDDLDKWDVRIDASDIDQTALKKAEQGIYEARSVKDVPHEYLEKYFIHFDNKFIIKNDIKRLVNLEYLNLSDQNFLRKKRGYDFIFCRNVLIYFDEVSRRKVVDHFYLALRKGGYIFLSSTESLSRITTAFKLRRMGGSLVYTKE